MRVLRTGSDAVITLRLQHLQLAGTLAAGICCLALGAMSFLGSFGDYRRMREGADAFRRFEMVSEAVSAIVAERRPANVLIAVGRTEATTAALARARAETDRHIGLLQSAIAGAGTAHDGIYALNDLRARLEIGRQLVDAFVATDQSRRRSQDFGAAMDEMFETATAAAVLSDRFGQDVIAIFPEASVEVFLSLAVGALRDNAGRLGSYVIMAQREGGRNPATFARAQEMSGRLQASHRIVRTLTRSLPPGSPVPPRVGDVEQHFYRSAIPMALDRASAAQQGADTMAEFAVSYARNLGRIDGLRDAIVASSQQRLKSFGRMSSERAMIAGALTLLVCLILVATIVVFRRAVFAPLGRAREQAIAIARGDLSEPLVGGRVVGEVGEMLAGLHAIRGEQRWRRELEEQQAEMSRQLKRLSETDVLTGLLNRRAAGDHAARALQNGDEKGQRLALLLFDVDHFKSINDTFGHAVGDEVLRAIARELEPLVRPQDSFARVGGEEFLVLMPDIALEEARAIAGRLRERLAERVRTPADRRVTASFGLAFREPGGAPTWDDLLAVADRRLYAAKKAGRNRVCDTDLVVIPSAERTDDRVA